MDAPNYQLVNNNSYLPFENAYYQVKLVVKEEKDEISQCRIYRLYWIPEWNES